MTRASTPGLGDGAAGMIVETVTGGPFATNAYVLANGAGEECVVVDPGIDTGPRLLELCDELRLKPVAVLLTHGHYDHTWAVTEIAGAHALSTWIHASDRWQLRRPAEGVGEPAGTPLLGRTSFEEPDDVTELTDDAETEVANLRLTIRHTPGHTPGSVTFILGQLVLSGDTVLPGKLPAMRFPGADHEALVESVRSVYLVLPDDSLILPGHGDPSTVGRERLANPSFVAAGEAASGKLTR